MTEEQLERKKQKQKEKRRRQREKKQEKAGTSETSETQEVAPPPTVKEVNDKFSSPGHKLPMVEQARPMLSLHCR